MKIESCIFHELRGTAVTRLGLSGATEPVIATINCLLMASGRQILDKHYPSRDPARAWSEISKLERSFGNQSGNCGQRH